MSDTRTPHSFSAERAPAPDPERGRPSSEPIYLTSVYDFSSIAASEPAFDSDGYVYTRQGRPNVITLEREVARIEGAQAAIATATGMTAILCALWAATNTGDRIVCQRDVYGGTRALLDHDAPRLGLHVEYVDLGDPTWAGKLSGARMLFVESLSNPLLREADLATLAQAAHDDGVLLCVDNTMASPVFRRPLEHGADIVLHSVTKFLGGHHDLCAGVIAGSAALIEPARARITRLGLGASPLDAWLAQRGLQTLTVRMERAQRTTTFLADKLRAHASVRRVHHPGWGALVSFDLGDRNAAERLVSRCAHIRLAPSLGGCETTLSHSASSSHRALSEADRRMLGIGEGLLRMSVGLEDEAALWDELSRALAGG